MAIKSETGGVSPADGRFIITTDGRLFDTWMLNTEEARKQALADARLREVQPELVPIPYKAPSPETMRLIEDIRGAATKVSAMYDDARMPDGPLVTVTKEMRVAGLSCAMSEKTDGDWMEEIYRAMHAAAPVPLVSEAEDKIAQLQRELAWTEKRANHNSALLERTEIDRDALRDECTRLHDALKLRTDEKEAMQSMIDMLSDRCQLWADEVARLRAAQRPALAAASPKPAHDPFREHATDRRRMGP